MSLSAKMENMQQPLMPKVCPLYQSPKLYPSSSYYLQHVLWLIASNAISIKHIAMNVIQILFFLMVLALNANMRTANHHQPSYRMK